MSFNSWIFLIFCPVVILVYYLLPHKVRWVWLLAASYFFYMSWNVWLVFLIFSTTAVSYLAGILIEKSNSTKVKKLWLILTLVVCLGLLVFFKYFNFLVGSVISVLQAFSLPISSWSLDILLPIGISFYTFQTLSYVIDVYRGKYKAEKHVGYYALFVSFFPQLVAGPIERPGDLIPQLKAEHHFDLDDFLIGFRIFVCGFFYKVCVADFLGIFVNKAFGSLSEATSLTIALASLLFCFQIYGDFNGYSEIATGTARMMGIRLTRNFNRPYMSLTYTEYFRRWHITLNRWFTYYLYIPLGGNRKGKFRKIINIIIVFFLCGLWHGANWTYVLWGLNCAFWLIMEEIFGPMLSSFFGKRGVDANGKGMRIFRHAIFLIGLIPGGILFRSQSIAEVGLAFQRLFTGWTPSFFQTTFAVLGMGVVEAIIVIALIGFMEYLITFSEINRDALTSERFSTMGAKKLVGHFAVMAAAIACIAFLWIYAVQNGGNSAFAYFQF